MSSLEEFVESEKHSLLTMLVEIAFTLEDHQDLPGLGQLGEALARWAEVQGIEVHRPTPPSPSLDMGIEL